MSSIHSTLVSPWDSAPPNSSRDRGNFHYQLPTLPLAPQDAQEQTTGLKLNATTLTLASSQPRLMLQSSLETLGSVGPRQMVAGLSVL